MNNWEKAIKTFQTSRLLEKVDPDASASRAFYSVWCVLAGGISKGRLTSKEAELELYRRWFKTRKLSAELKGTYLFLKRLAEIADRAGGLPPDDSWQAVEASFVILLAVHKIDPRKFPDTIGLNGGICNHS